MKCDQCVAAMINGVFCHETGCPNTFKVWDNLSQQWKKVYQCDCGEDVFVGEQCFECHPDEPSDDTDYDAPSARERNEMLGREDRD